MDMNPILPAIDRAKVDECYYKSGMRLYQQGDMRDAADRFEKCYPAYLKDTQYNFIAGRANAVIKHWEPAARHLIVCTDLEERYRFDLCTARAYSIVNLCTRQENRLIAMFVANLDFQQTIKDYKWIKINYAKLSVTNDIENVSNVLMKIDREKTSGEVVVTLQRPDPADQKSNQTGTLNDRDKEDAQESLLTIERSYQNSLEVINNRIRELEAILNEIIKTNGGNKHIIREKFKKKIDRFNMRIKELEIIDKREMKANEDILKQLERDIIHHNAVRADLKSILEKRNIPELKDRAMSVAKKIDELKKVNRMFKKFISERTLRNAKIDLFLKSIVESAEKETLTPEQLSEAAVKIRGYYTAEDKTYIECVQKFTESLNIDLDLSSLEEYLPKDKSDANKAKAEAEAAKAQPQPEAPAPAPAK